MLTPDEKIAKMYQQLDFLNEAYKADACDLHVTFKIDQTRKAGKFLYNVRTSDITAIRLSIHKIATSIGATELNIIATAPIQKL